MEETKQLIRNMMEMFETFNHNIDEFNSRKNEFH